MLLEANQLKLLYLISHSSLTRSNLRTLSQKYWRSHMVLILVLLRTSSSKHLVCRCQSVRLSPDDRTEIDTRIWTIPIRQPANLWSGDNNTHFIHGHEILYTGRYYSFAKLSNRNIGYRAKSTPTSQVHGNKRCVVYMELGKETEIPLSSSC
jgi:hypothetical protein